MEGSQLNQSHELQKKQLELELGKASQNRSLDGDDDDNNNISINVASPSPIFITSRIVESVKEFMEGVRAGLKLIKENMDERMNEMDKWLIEKDNLLKEKDDLLEKKDQVIGVLIKKLSGLYEESDTFKKRRFGDIATTSNTSPERRTRSRVLYQDTDYEQEEENATSAGKGGENATSSA